jgi:hypothetical protein
MINRPEGLALEETDSTNLDGETDFEIESEADGLENISGTLDVETEVLVDGAGGNDGPIDGTGDNELLNEIDALGTLLADNGAGEFDGVNDGLCNPKHTSFNGRLKFLMVVETLEKVQVMIIVEIPEAVTAVQVKLFCENVTPLLTSIQSSIFPNEDSFAIKTSSVPLGVLLVEPKTTAPPSLDTASDPTVSVLEPPIAVIH